MRQYTGVPYSMVQDPIIRRSLSLIDYFLRDASFGFRRIENGQVPSGSGDTIPVGEGGTLDDYLFLPGRPGGQRIRSVDEAVTLTIDSADSDLSVNGSIGNPALRLRSGTTPLVDFRPYKFDSTVEIALTDDTGTGIGVNFPSDDGTSAFRIASTTNRSYLQFGLKQSSGNVQNANVTIGATGARVATSMATEFQRINLNITGATLPDGSAATVRTCRIGINLSPDDFSGSSAANKGTSLHLGDLNGAVATDPAPLVIENSDATSSRRLLDFRLASTGSSPNRTIGALLMTVDSDQNVTGYNSGSRRGRMRGITSGTGSGGFAFENTNDRNIMDLLVGVSGGFADSVATNAVRLGNTTEDGDRTFIASGGTVAFARLGIRATSTILGPAAFSVMPAPVSSRLLTLVNSSGTVGAYFGSGGELRVQPTTDSIVLSLQPVSTTTNDIAEAFDAAALKVFKIDNTGVSFYNGVIGITDGSGADAANNVLIDALSISAARTWSFPNADGLNFVGTSASQTITNKIISSGGVSLTGQTASIGTTNITISPSSVAMYEVEVFAMCTTAGTAGTLDVTIGWTDTVGATTMAASAQTAVGATAVWPLTLAATGRAFARFILRRASGNITYATTVAGALGSPQYALYIRTLGLG